MLEATPIWTTQRPASAIGWPSRARFEGSSVLGQFYRLDRETGSVVWERTLPEVNYIVGVHDEMILCTELDPAWRPGTRACGIRLANGDVVWSSAVTPLAPNRDEFLCMDGTVRDIGSGKVIRTQSVPPKFYVHDFETSASRSLMQASLAGRGLEIAPGIFAVADKVRSRKASADFSAHTTQGEVLWRFCLADQGWHCGGSRFDRFVAPPYIYLLASRSPP